VPARSTQKIGVLVLFGRAVLKAWYQAASEDGMRSAKQPSDSVWTSDDLSFAGKRGIVDEIGPREESSDDLFLLSDGLVV